MADNNDLEGQETPEQALDLHEIMQGSSIEQAAEDFPVSASVPLSGDQDDSALNRRLRAAWAARYAMHYSMTGPGSAARPKRKNDLTDLDIRDGEYNITEVSRKSKRSNERFGGLTEEQDPMYQLRPYRAMFEEDVEAEGAEVLYMLLLQQEAIVESLKTQSVFPQQNQNTLIPFKKNSNYQLWTREFLNSVTSITFAAYCLYKGPLISPYSEVNIHLPIFRIPVWGIKLWEKTVKIQASIDTIIAKIQNWLWSQLCACIRGNVEAEEIANSLFGKDQNCCVLWQRLHTKYAREFDMDKSSEIRKFQLMQRETNEKFKQWTSRVQTTLAKLKNDYQYDVSETDLKEKLLYNALPIEAAHFDTFHYLGLSLPDVVDKIITLMARFDEGTVSSGGSTVPTIANQVQSVKGDKRTCFHCGKPGHIKAECYQLHGKQHGSPGGSQQQRSHYTPKSDGRTAHSQQRAFSRSSDSQPKKTFKGGRKGGRFQRKSPQFQVNMTEQVQQANVNQPMSSSSPSQSSQSPFMQSSHSVQVTRREGPDYACNVTSEPPPRGYYCSTCYTHDADHLYWDCPKGHHTASNTTVRVTYNDEPSLPSMNLTPPAGSVEIAYNTQVIDDSGATVSMFNDRRLFKDLRPNVEGYKVLLADGSRAEVEGIGNVGFLKNVLLVPTLKRCLISVGQLDKEMGFSVIHKAGKCTVISNDGTVLLCGTYDPVTHLYTYSLSDIMRGYQTVSMSTAIYNREYMNDVVNIAETKKEAIDRLHKITHYSPHRIQEMVKQGILQWDNPAKPTFFIKYMSECAYCKLAKATRASFLGHIPQETVVGRTWYMDVCGPYETPSIKGNKYIVGFIEAMSKKCFLYFTETKSVFEQVANLVKTEIVRLRVRSNKLQDFTLWSDLGEATSQSISEFVAQHGGRMHHSCAYTPETMSIIERLWRTLTEMSSVMLLSSGLSEPFWQDATQYAALLYNRTPRASSTPGERKSPVEIYDETKPRMDKCQPFGCRAYAQIPKQLRRKNHKGRAEMCIFVGFQEDMSPGYKLYRPLHRDYIVSAHVKFAPMLQYDVKIGGEQKIDMNTPTNSVESYQYLVGLLHLDPDDGLVYKTTEIKTSNFQGSEVIVAKRSMVPLEGPEVKDTDLYHVRDIEQMTIDTDEMRLEVMGYSKIPLDWCIDDFPADDAEESVEDSDYQRVSVDLQVNEEEPLMEEGRVPNGRPRNPSNKKRTASVKMSKNRKKTRKEAGSQSIIDKATESVIVVDPVEGYHRRVRREPKRLAFNVAHAHSLSHTCTKHCVMSVSNPNKSSEVEDSSVTDELLDSSLLQVLYGGGFAAYALICNREVLSLSEPTTRDEAIASAQCEQWIEAEKLELKSLVDNNVVGQLEVLPPGKKRVRLKWVYKIKRDKNNAVLKYKARLVAQGFTQIFGLDYHDTYSPVTRLQTLRMIFALAAELELDVKGFDVDTAFLYASLNEDVYVDAPPGQPSCPQGHGYKLVKALYGLKQSPREWNRHINTFLVNTCGYKRLSTETCVYYSRPTSGQLVILALYVDDIVIAYSDEKLYEDFKKKLMTEYKVKDQGRVERVLNMEVDRTAEGGYFLSQSAYIKDIIHRFSKDFGGNLSSSELPHDPYVQLYSGGAIYKKTSSTEAELAAQGEASDPIPTAAPYREVLGALLWLSEGTRPDIKYIVSTLGKFAASPRKAHWAAMKRVFRYLVGTMDMGISYTRTNVNSLSNPCTRVLPTGSLGHMLGGSRTGCLSGMVDSDFANDIDDRRSITGYVFKLANGPISWQSRAQQTVAISTMEAEYMALAAAAQEALWLRHILRELKFPLDGPVLLSEDNKACMDFAKHPTNHRKTKHIDYKYHFVRERIDSGELMMTQVTSAEQEADMFTKPLQRKEFLYLRRKLMTSRNALVQTSQLVH